MIIEETLYGIKCDGCAEIYINEHSGFAYWGDSQDAIEEATEDGWHREEAENYCPNCHEFDQDDNLIIKTKKQ